MLPHGGLGLDAVLLDDLLGEVVDKEYSEIVQSNQCVKSLETKRVEIFVEYVVFEGCGVRLQLPP